MKMNYINDLKLVTIDKRGQKLAFLFLEEIV